MDRDMIQHPATRANLDRLRSYGTEVMPTARGELASGLVGPGRMPEPEAILARITAKLVATEATSAQAACALRGQTVLVTAGPTHEPIDPVRFLTNRSTGTMGYVLAAAAARRGARVILVSGPTALDVPEGVTRVDVTSAEAMHEAVMAHAPEANLVLMAAAVADYTPATVHDRKIKKDDKETDFVLHLRRTPDILHALGQRKREGQTLVGFALETDDAEANARRKLERKNLDWIALNSPLAEGEGFGTTTNRVTLIARAGTTEPLPLMPKAAVAEAMLDRMLAAAA
jgi:phosphopantothenoylcysteine decarboxylase/phosphopantothenate--cysteine ligase